MPTPGTASTSTPGTTNHRWHRPDPVEHERDVELILITPNGIENLSDIRAVLGSHPYQEVMDSDGDEFSVRSGGG
ncbi:MAG: hypothetical protein ACYDC4_03070 [Candidatus Dormibacteria bacterium]